MASIAHTHPFVVGVDTHTKHHVYTLITPIGHVLGTKTFPTTSQGITRALSWIAKATGGDMDTLWVIEGCASYGAILAGSVAAAGYLVAEAPFYTKRGGRGKTDELDSARIATATLPLALGELRIPRLDEGVRASLQVLLTARESMTHERTSHVNALNALARIHDLGVDARTALTTTQIAMISRWRDREEPLAKAIARAEAIRLATRIRDLDTTITTNLARMKELVEISQGAPLLDETGYGPVTVATCLTAWSHQGRLTSEAAFAALAGVNPIPASSGNTVRHRLNRGGDRRLNKALHTIALTRMVHDPTTREYVERRRHEGRTTREIRRCLKRYIARHIYRTLNTTPTPHTT